MVQQEDVYSNSGLYPIDANSISSPGMTIEICPQTLPHGPWGYKIALRTIGLSEAESTPLYQFLVVLIVVPRALNGGRSLGCKVLNVLPQLPYLLNLGLP